MSMLSINPLRSFLLITAVCFALQLSAETFTLNDPASLPDPCQMKANPAHPVPAADLDEAAPPVIQAALFNHNNNKTYFFSKNYYYRLTGTTVDDGYPKALPGGWRGLPLDFQSNLDAAVYDQSNGKIYLFKGGKYVRITGTQVDGGYPRNLPGEWTGCPISFNNGIDAAIYRSGHVYFFKGGQYLKFKDRVKVQGYPANLPGGWGFPSDYHKNIGAAIAFKPNGKNYFFKSGTYIRCSDTKTDSGYPAGMPGGWKGFDNPKVSVKSNIWTIGGLQEQSFEMTQEDLESGLANTVSARSVARDVADRIFEGMGGWEQVFEVVTSADDFGTAVGASIVLAMMGSAAGLGAGIAAIVQRVRAENGTNVAIYNGIKGGKITVTGVSSDFDGLLLHPTNTNTYAPSKMYGAVADNSSGDAMSGMVFNLQPNGGKSRMKGSVNFKVSIPGKGTHTFQLNMRNRVGAGQESEYILSGPTPTITHTSNRYDIVREKYHVASGKFKVIMRLEHAQSSSKYKEKDQRKDVLSISFVAD